MKWWIWAVGMGMCLGTTGFAQEIDPEVLARYLTKEKKLTFPIEVRDEKKGFGTFAGTIWRIDPNGRWTVTGIYINQVRAVAQGQLKPKELENLARTLAIHDPLTLRNVGEPLVNPHVVTISFGPARAQLTFGVDQVLPKVVTKEPMVPKLPAYVKPTPATQNPYLPSGAPKTANEDWITRYGGIQSAVRSIIETNHGRPFPQPDNPRLTP